MIPNGCARHQCGVGGRPGRALAPHRFSIHRHRPSEGSIRRSCLDSRSAPEVAFDQGVGDICVGRVAGNVIDTNLLGSFGFATAAAGSKLIGAVHDISTGEVTFL